MRALILDYLKRWRWVLLGILLVHGLCMGSVCQTGHGVVIGLFAGSYLLTVDLIRGQGRALLALPVSARIVGRSWWWVSVGWPAVGLGVMTVLGAAASTLIGPRTGLDAAWLLGWIVGVFVLLGSLFCLLTVMPVGPVHGFVANVKAALAGGLWGLGAAGMLTAPEWLGEKRLEPSLLVLLLTVGTVLTVLGWLRAEQAVLRRTLPSGVAGSSKPRSFGPLLTTRPSALTGWPLVITTAFLRVLGIGIALVVTMTLVWLVLVLDRKAPITERFVAALREGAMPIQVAFWYLTVFALAPWTRSMRVLRPLPVSAAGLAAVTVFVGCLPGLAFVLLEAILSVTVQTDLALLTTLKLAAVMTGFCVLTAPGLLRFGLGYWFFFAMMVIGSTGFMAAMLFLKGVGVELCLCWLFAALAASFWLTWRELSVGTAAWRHRPWIVGSFGQAG